MNDLILAKEALHKNDYTFVAVKEGKIVYSSRLNGILPVYLAFTNSKLPIGSSVADKCIGKATALILKEAKVKSIYADIISIPGNFALKDSGISVMYNELVTHILNKNKNDLCPIEKLCIDINGLDNVLASIKDFFDKVGIDYNLEN